MGWVCQDPCCCTLGRGAVLGCEMLSEKEQKWLLVMCHTVGDEVWEQKKAAANTEHM